MYLNNIIIPTGKYLCAYDAKKCGVKELEIKVRVSETDALGHINNASYFTYLEDARIDFLEEMGISIKDEVFAFMLVSTKCDFISQGYFGQILQVDTKVLKIGTKSLTLVSDILDKESGKVIAKGEATIVYFNLLDEKTIEIPDAFKTQLQAYMQTT